MNKIIIYDRVSEYAEILEISLKKTPFLMFKTKKFLTLFFRRSSVLFDWRVVWVSRLQINSNQNLKIVKDDLT
jgi:hypothetical protein